jgi:hypothetical protein
MYILSSDSETTLQVINKWIGGGVKFSLVRPPNGDVLPIIIKLQKRVKTGAVRDREINRPLTQAESNLTREDVNKETIAHTRF